MKLTLDRDVALTAVARAAAICARTNTIPILGHVVIEAGKGTVRFRACNMEAEVTATVSADVAEPGDTAVPAHQFWDILKNAKAGADVVLTLDASDPRASVKSGRSNFKLPVLPPDMLPSFVMDDAEHELTLDAGWAKFLFSTVLHAAARDDTRPGLLAICLKAEGDKLKAYATNNKRVAASEIEHPGAGEWARMLPARAAEQFAQLADGAEKLTLRIGASLIEASAGGVRIISKLMDSQPVRYEALLGQEKPYTATVNRADLLQAARRALIVNVDQHRSLRLDFTPNSLSVSTRAPASGEAADEIEATYDGPELYAILNGSYLLEPLAQIDGPTVQIQLADNKQPLLLTDPAEPRARFLVGVQHG